MSTSSLERRLTKCEAQAPTGLVRIVGYATNAEGERIEIFRSGEFACAAGRLPEQFTFTLDGPARAKDRPL